MIIKTRAVRDLARECKIPDPVIEQYMDELIKFAWRISKKENGHCRTLVRTWLFNEDIGKPPLLEVLRDEDENYELL